MSEFQNIEIMLVFTIVYGIRSHLLIVLPIRLKHCISTVLFFFARQNVCLQNIGRPSEVSHQTLFLPLGVFSDRFL